MPASWTDGYVADLDYTHGFYRELMPSILGFTALVRGVRAPSMDGPLAYCELGCGQGFSANLLAAANPQAEVHATDFNPAHIVGARALAAAAGSPNVHFHDRSFGEFLEEPGLPDFDVIALHGIYSWVSAENRRTIVEFIRRRLKPGGLAYISYNCLPGLAPVMPLRRLLADHAATGSGPIAARIGQAVGFAQRILDADPIHARSNPAFRERLGQIRDKSANYLAHEYFNRDWTPFYYADVAADLAGAKLTYVGSAYPLDHVDGINLTDAQRGLLDEIADPILRETVQDVIVNRHFRRDVFVKGTVSLSLPELRDGWLDRRYALTAHRPDVVLTVKGTAGEATLQPEIYGPLLDALAGGPKTLRRMMADPAVGALGLGRLKQALLVLVGMGYVQPCPDADGDAGRAARTSAFNRAVMERSTVSTDLNYLASPVTGGGVLVDRISQLFLLAAGTGQTDAVRFVWETLTAAGHRLSKGGKVVETAEEGFAELRARLRSHTDKMVPVLRTLGIA